ncbi:MAG: thiamine pyrophosphate-binding protein [Acetobacterales bacterium]
MASNANSRDGGQALADALKVHGVDHVFCVPGESYLALLNGLYEHRDDVKVVTCRFEAGAANMAEAYGKLTGKPGVVIVTRGPGACHGAVGLHTGFQDSSPMVMLIGQVPRDSYDRESFQEMDYRRLFSQTTKWTAQIEQADRIPEIMNHAFHMAASGRPGPVAVSIPEDMQRDITTAPDSRPYMPVRAHPGPAQMQQMREMLAKAKKPLLMVGGAGWDDKARDDIRAFAAANNLPTCVTFRRHDIFDATMPTYVGDISPATDPALVQRIKDCDLLLVAGARLGDITTGGYTTLSVPTPTQTIVHVHPDSGEIGRVHQVTLAIQAGMPEFAAAAVALEDVKGGWGEWAKSARADRVTSLESPKLPGKLDLAECMHILDSKLPDDGIVTCDAGNHAAWPGRFLNFRKRQRYLGPTVGAMGYSVPAATAASIMYPDRMVVATVGDGGFMMTGQEVVTAFQHGGKPIILLFNNGMYGTIRMHQERDFPERVIGTTLQNPSFAKIMEAYGGHAEVVSETKEFGPAFDRCVAAGKPALIELMVDQEHLTTRATLSQIREKALAAAKK